MQALIEALVALNTAALGILGGTVLSLVWRRRIARRDVNDYLRWLFAELEES